MEAASSQRSGIQRSPQALFFHAARMSINQSFFFFLFFIIYAFLSFYLCFGQATLGTNGTPSNRTVVFRGFQDNTDNIQINTHARTPKVLLIFDQFFSFFLLLHCWELDCGS